MAFTTTTLAASCLAGDLQLTLTDTTGAGFPAVGAAPLNQPIQIDGEITYLVSTLSKATPGVIKVARRGSEGTFAVAHDILAPVRTSPLPADFSQPSAPAIADITPTVDAVVTIGQDQAIVVPLVSTTYYITKASAAAITIAASANGTPGVKLTFISQTSFAHTITYTPGFGAGTTANDVATFGSTPPAVLGVEVGANGLLWATTTLNVTIA